MSNANLLNNGYQPWMCQKIIQVAERGGRVPAMCRAIGIKSKDTFYRWIKEYKDFEEAYSEAKLAYEEFSDSVALRGALGTIKGYQHKPLEMFMTTALEDDYTKDGGKVEISLNQLSMEDLDAKIAALQERLKLLPEEKESATDVQTE